MKERKIQIPLLFVCKPKFLMVHRTFKKRQDNLQPSFRLELRRNDGKGTSGGIASRICVTGESSSCGSSPGVTLLVFAGFTATSFPVEFWDGDR